MMNYFLVKEDGSENLVVIGVQGFVPVGALAKVPAHLKDEPLKLIEGEVAVDEEKKSLLAKAVVEAQIEATAGIDSQLDISQDEVLLALLMDDVVAKEKLKSRYLYRLSVEESHKEEAMGRRMIVLDLIAGPKIVQGQVGENHSAKVCNAPHGFGPGDEQFLQILRTENEVRLIIDWEGKLASEQAKANEKKALVKAEEWNSKSILGRIVSAVRPGNSQ